MEDGSCYQNGREHLEDELLKLDLSLELQIMKQRELFNNRETAGSGGLYITETEIDRISGKGGEQASADNASLADEIKSLHKRWDLLRHTILGKVENTLQGGVDLPLYRLASLFRLKAVELDILIICLAPELDLKYERIYAYLLDDVTRKSPSVNLILDLLSMNRQERFAVRSCLLDSEPLFRYELVSFTGDTGDTAGPVSCSGSFLSRGLKLDDRITHFLQGFDGLDSRLSSVARITRSQRRWESLVMEPELKAQFRRLAGNCLQESSGTDRGLVFYLKGPYGVGKRSLAEVFCGHLGIPLILVDTGNLSIRNKNNETALHGAVNRLFREALFQAAALFFDGFDRLFAGGSGYGLDDAEYLRVLEKCIVGAVNEFACLTFLAGETEWYPPVGFGEQAFIKIDLPVPSYQLRKRLWRQCLNGRYPAAAESDIEAIANKFNFTPGQILDAVAEARNRSVIRGGHGNIDDNLAMDDLVHSCRCQSNQKLSRMAQKIKPRYSWSDIVLPPDKFRQLEEICSHVRYRQTVYSQWGFGAKFSLGKGLNILFSGPSGTGKTMAAEVIAGNLELDLYKLDLSGVVSKYIGETEKNLNRIFHEAETANCILFFDEADALFGKRSEVKDAHDRYANIEINYLLQKMEEHEGTVILATNFLKNIDEAFKRRIHFSVDFSFPDEIYRLKIWQSIFPPQMPRSERMDFEFLARKFKLSGGNIKNIAVNAAFLAAEKSRQVDMSHTIQATRRELQKMGRHCSPADFGKYYEFIVPGGGEELE